MRLLPKTLSGRLLLILLAGLLLTQVTGTIILLQDRARLMSERSGLFLFSRIGNIVTLVEELPLVRRQQVIAAIDSPGFRVWLADQAIEPEAPPDSRAIERLQRFLPGDRPVRVDIREPEQYENPHHRPPPRGPGHGMRRPPPKGGIHVQVQLADQSWLNFRRPIDRFQAYWPTRVFAYIGLLLASTLLLTLLAVRLLTRPLKTLARAADGLGRDINQAPLRETGSSEVAAASRAFNTMQQRLQRYIRDRGQVLAAVSHDLKTPITRLRLRSEMLKDEAITSAINRDLDEMEQMVSSSLEFLRGSESSEKPSPIDIPALLESIRDDLTDTGLQITLAENRAAPFTGRPNLLKRCIVNLAGNAAHYGGNARIEVEDSGKQLLIRIIDSGPGVPEEELEKLFQPFYRLDDSRDRRSGGTGLGLGIARNIARAHGGDVTLHLPAAGGLEARIALPR